MIEYFGKIVEVEPKMKTYTCEFTFNSTTGTNVAIVFEMGKIGTETDKAHDIVLDNVHIEKIASPSVSPVPSEDLREPVSPLREVPYMRRSLEKKLT